MKDLLFRLVPSATIAGHIQDEDGEPAGATVTLYDGERPIARSQVRARRLIVLALGDSYASGEGNPDVPTRWREGHARSQEVDLVAADEA